MKRFGIIATNCGLVLLFTGCASDVLRMEQDHIRRHLLQLHEWQIMDNLIRVHNFLPIVQLDYTDMTGTVKDTANAMGSGSQMDASGAITNMIGYEAGATRENQITITADPATATSSSSDKGKTREEVYEYDDKNRIKRKTVTITNLSESSPGIYQDYVSFVWKTELDKLRDKVKKARDAKDEVQLRSAERAYAQEVQRIGPGISEIADPETGEIEATGRIETSKSEPNDSTAHRKLERDGVWYYIPVIHKGDFLKLSVRVMVRERVETGADIATDVRLFRLNQ